MNLKRRISKFTNFIYTFPPYLWLIRYKRSVVKAKVKANKNTKSPGSKISNLAIINLAKKYKFIIAIASIALIFLTHLKLITDIDLKTYEFYNNTNFSSQKNFFAPIYPKLNLNTVILVTENDYLKSLKFVKGIYLFSINKKTSTVKSLSSNPNFLIDYKGQNSTLYDLLNKDGITIEEIISSLSSLIGLRIDRYIIIPESEIISNAYNWGLNLKVIYSEGIENYEYSRVLNTDEVLNLIVNTKLSIKNDNLSKIYLDLFNTNLEKFKNIIFLYRLIWEGKNIADLLETNFSRDEVINLILTLNNSDLIINSTYLGKNEGAESESLLGVLDPNYKEIDSKVSQTFFSLDSVKEQARIEIFNATLQTGLAARAKRLLRNKGLTIVKEGNYFEQLEETIIFFPGTNSIDFPNTLTDIGEELFQNYKLEKEAYSNNYSGDIIVVLGKQSIGI